MSPARSLRQAYLHSWDVTLRDTTKDAEYIEPVHANWDPDHVLTPESVAQAALCQAIARTHRKDFMPIGVEQTR